MLKTKSFLAPIEASDGWRISVVGKHKWAPGIMTYTDLTEITKNMYDEWMKELAPPLLLVGDLYIRKTLSHEQFRDRYFDFLEQREIDLHVRDLAYRSLTSTITALCVEPDYTFCHRNYLAQQCQKREPSLILSIR